MQELPDKTEPTIHFLDYWRVIRSRKEIILAVSLLIVLTGTAYTLTLPKQFTASARIEVQGDAMDVDVFERQGGFGYNPYYLRTQYEILKSKPILLQVVDRLDLPNRWATEDEEGQKTPTTRQGAYERLKGKINVHQFRDTTLIALTATSDKGREAADIANALAVVYGDHRLTVKRQELKRGIESLRNEVQKQKERVDEAEAKLQVIRRELNISELGRGFKADKMQLSRLEGDRISSKVQMLIAKSRLEQLEALKGDELINAAVHLVNDPALVSLRRQLVDSQIAMELLLQDLGENHPDVRRLRTGVAELKEKIQEALNGLLIGVRSSYEVAKAKYEALEGELELVRDTDIESESERYLPFDKAERDLGIQRSILNALRARLTQEAIELEIPRSPVEIVDEADVPKRHVKPNLLLNIMISLVLGLAAGVGLAYFIEYLDTSVKTIDDVERYLSLPVLGVIPQKVRALVEEGPDSPHAEAYRVLRTNLQFSMKDSRGGAYGVISGGVGEGKSTTIFNLAYVCAQLGDKVLIVDSDLRRPVLHTILGLSNRFGLTNVLLRDVPIEETIKTTSVPNLHFIPSGRLPRSSLGLLDSQRMRDLVKTLKSRYDYVFFDSPPVMGVSDASILASEMDGVVLVVQYRKYPRIITARAKRIIESVGGNILGVVLNNINILRDDYYYYYHSYYSQYYQSGQSQPPEEAAERRTEVETI